MGDTHLQRLVTEYREDGTGERRSHWIDASRRFFASPQSPSFLNVLGDEACIVLHGSTTRNVDDAYSDLDFYLLLNEDATAHFDSLLPSRFVDVEIDGKPGHLNVTSVEQLTGTFDRPDLESIYELQHAVAVRDPLGVFAPISTRTTRPMSTQLRRAALLFNYIEMRSFHRSADNPMDRHDRLSTLGSVIEAIHYAIRCARVIDGMTYPYSKWLYVAATASPTGKRLVPLVDEILDLVQAGPGSLDGPEKTNRISSLLRSFRPILVDAANQIGIDEQWLQQWWLFFDEQRRAFDDVTWSA